MQSFLKVCILTKSIEFLCVNLPFGVFVANNAKPAPAPSKSGPTASTSRPVASGSRLRQNTSGGRHASAPSDRHQYYRSSGSHVDSAIDPPAAVADSRTGPTTGNRRHRKLSSGNLRSTLRGASKLLSSCVSFEHCLTYAVRIWLSVDAASISASISASAAHTKTPPPHLETSHDQRPPKEC
jgi:hypothetical protein